MERYASIMRAYLELASLALLVGDPEEAQACLSNALGYATAGKQTYAAGRILTAIRQARRIDHAAH